MAYGSVIAAHEIGTTRVAVTFHDARTYDVTIATDASSLLDKLDAAAHTPGAAGRTSAAPALLRDRLNGLNDVFLQRATIAFDGTAARARVSLAVAPAADSMSPMLATIHLTGEIPAGARRFTWNYGWTFASYALSLKVDDSAVPVTEWLEGGVASQPFVLATRPPRVSSAATAWRYLALGFSHIVPNGLDHILFVLGIFLLTGRVRSILAQVSAFTVAHSITLGLSLYGVIAVSPSIVEPLIAVSIAYVAVENLLLTELRSWRVALVFAFGLLHGLGFAGALKELGLPRSEFLTALVTFNVGVEAGQLAVIAAAFAIVAWPCRHHSWYRRRVVMPASAAIACTAVYWTIERALL